MQIGSLGPFTAVTALENQVWKAGVSMPLSAIWSA